MMMIIIKTVLLLLFGRFSLRIQTTWRKTTTTKGHGQAAPLRRHFLRPELKMDSGGLPAEEAD